MSGGGVLVTGAGGFLGSHLVRNLHGNVDVIAMLRPGSDPWRLGDIPGVRVLHGDLDDVASLRTVITKAEPETIFHFAGSAAARRFGGDWQQVRAAQRTNVDGLINLLEAADSTGKRLRTLVRLGGLEEYGSGAPPFTEDQREAPRSPYSASQVAGTHLAQALQPHLRFALVTLRPTLIYGPAQSTDFLIPSMIEALLAGRRFAISAGEQRRDLLHVDDFVCAAAALIGRDDLAGSVLNIASGDAPRIRDVAERLADLLGARDLLDVGEAGTRANEIMDLRGDASAARRLLGWQPEIGLDQGLRETIAWHRERRDKVTP